MKKSIFLAFGIVLCIIAFFSFNKDEIDRMDYLIGKYEEHNRDWEDFIEEAEQKKQTSDSHINGVFSSDYRYISSEYQNIINDTEDKINDNIDKINECIRKKNSIYIRTVIFGAGGLAMLSLFGVCTIRDKKKVTYNSEE